MDIFNILIYKLANNDLRYFSDKELVRHYNMYGKYENRICNIINFDINYYKDNNNDLKNLNDEKLINHYIKYGHFENRICNVNNVPTTIIKSNSDFDIMIPYIDEANQDVINKFMGTNNHTINKGNYRFINNNNLSSYFPYYKETLETIIEMVNVLNTENKFDIIILSLNSICYNCEDNFYNCINNECTILKVSDINNIRLDYYLTSLDDDVVNIGRDINIGYITRPCFKGNCKKCNYLWNIYYKVTSYWDNVFCINLGLDITKRQNMLKYCNLLNAKKESFFYKGILGINAPNIKILKRLGLYGKDVNENITDGTIGLNITQQKLIKNCIKEKYKHVLILEDDISFNEKEYLHILNFVFNKYDTIDILYLGCSNYEKNINSIMDLVDISYGNYNIYRPKKNILQKVCIGGFFAVLLSQKALQIYNERFTPINNISDVLLCDITYDIKNDYGDNNMTKTKNDLKSYYIIKNLVNADISKPSMTDNNINNILTLKKFIDNKYINYLSKIKKINFINEHEKGIITVYISKLVLTYYNDIANLILSKFKKFNKININKAYDSICNIYIYTIHDTDITINAKCINICINGENKPCSIGTDIGIITNYQFTNPYNIYFSQLELSLWERHDVFSKTNTKKYFCAYMYSYDIPHRVNIFNYISTYKKVDAMGKSCFNIENNKKSNTRNVYDKDKTYNDIAVEIYSDYKFVLALENEDGNGYVTEKLLNPLLASAIPIYYGSADAFKIINKKRVIYINDYNSYNELLEHIKLVDTDDELYNSYIKEPMFVNCTSDPASTLITITNIRTYFKNILSENIDKAFGKSSKNILITKKHVNSHNYDFIINGLNSKTDISDFTSNNDIINYTHTKSIDFVDKILWINLEKSIDRNNYMTDLLKNVAIPNIRINAINGNTAHILHEHGNTTHISPEHCNTTHISPEHGNTTHILPEHGNNASILPEHGNNASISPEHGNNASILPEHCNKDTIKVIEDPKEAFTNINHDDCIGNIKNTTMSKSEIGCTLSHIKAINYLKNIEGEYFLICEDDITLVNINLIPKTLEEIIINAPKFDILLIHKIYCRHLSKIYTNWNKEYNKSNSNNNYAISSTAGYVISRSGINKICNDICSYDSITNKFTFYKQISVADIFLYNYTNTWVYKYNFISTRDEDSIIHGSHIEYHKKSSKIQLDVINNDFGYATSSIKLDIS